MAIEFSYNDPYGVAHPNAYCRVIGINFRLDQNFVAVRVSIYHNAQARQAGKMPLLEKRYDAANDQTAQTFTAHFSGVLMAQVGNTPQTQTYSYLKNLPEYQRGLDV